MIGKTPGQQSHLFYTLKTKIKTRLGTPNTINNLLAQFDGLRGPQPSA